MSPRLRKYLNHMKVMGTSSPAMCKAMIKSADSGLINCLCECVLNILKGNVPLSHSQKGKLSRHRKDLRHLANKKVALKKKKRILQKGGILPAVLAPVIGPLVAGIGAGIGSIIQAVKK